MKAEANSPSASGFTPAEKTWRRLVCRPIAAMAMESRKVVAARIGSLTVLGDGDEAVDRRHGEKAEQEPRKRRLAADAVAGDAQTHAQFAQDDDHLAIMATRVSLAIVPT